MKSSITSMRGLIILFRVILTPMRGFFTSGKERKPQRKSGAINAAA